MAISKASSQLLVLPGTAHDCNGVIFPFPYEPMNQQAQNDSWGSKGTSKI